MAKKLDVDLDIIEALAGKGYTTSMICNAIGINRTTAWRNSSISNAIKSGRDLAKQKVIDHLMNRSLEDQGAAATIFLCKQMKIFDDHFPTNTPKNIKEAQTKIKDIYKAVAVNDLSTEKADKLCHYLEIYIKSVETTELQQRIEEIELQLRKGKK